MLITLSKCTTSLETFHESFEDIVPPSNEKMQPTGLARGKQLYTNMLHTNISLGENTPSWPMGKSVTEHWNISSTSTCPRGKHLDNSYYRCMQYTLEVQNHWRNWRPDPDLLFTQILSRMISRRINYHLCIHKSNDRLPGKVCIIYVYYIKYKFTFICCNLMTKTDGSAVPVLDHLFSKGHAEQIPLAPPWRARCLGESVCNQNVNDLMMQQHPFKRGFITCYMKSTH